MTEDDFKNKPNNVVLGKCLGVRFDDRGQDDFHTMITILVEDDGHWSPNMRVSSYWIDDFISVLQAAKLKLNNEYFEEKDSIGWRSRRSHGNV